VYAATANLNALKLVPQTATQITAGGYGVANSQYLYVRSADSVPYIGAARIALYSDFEPTRQRLDAFFGPENATGVNPHYSYIPVGLDTLYSVAMAIIDLRDGVDGVSASVTALEARVDVLENCDCPTRLTELADVQRSEPVVAGQVLSYLGNDTWGNATIAQALSDLTDVDLSENVGEMQPLVYLEGKWAARRRELTDQVRYEH
jgi:hypothetical protein